MGGAAGAAGAAALAEGAAAAIDPGAAFGVAGVADRLAADPVLGTVAAGAVSCVVGAPAGAA
jgi:hypothetical protein